MGIVLRKSSDRGYRFPIILGAVLASLLLVGMMLQKEDSDEEHRAVPEIRLRLGKKSLLKIQAKRRKALQAGLLISSPDDWVKGDLSEGKDKWKVKLRLKGDWTDHLKGGKWSFRIQVRDSGAFHGMKVFSLQNPRTRDFLSEWYFHQVLRNERVLAPRYEFVRLKLNGVEVGLYALEEHFRKEMVESLGHREGVLLKFSEAGMWDARREALEDVDFPYEKEPFYESAEVVPFQWNKVKKDPKLAAAFRIAHALMDQYKHGRGPIEELFELDAVARQYALTDLFDGHHSLIWHNRRFYYNPVTSHLQPVVFDAFSGDSGGKYMHGPFTGHGCNGNTWYGGNLDLLGTRFFASYEFVRGYYKSLMEYSSSEFLQSLENRHGERLRFLERALQPEFLFYNYPEKALYEHAKRIREALVVDPEKVVWERSGGSVCLQNFNPIPIDLLGWESHGVRNWQAPVLLNAFDGRNPAVAIELDEAWEKVAVAIPGGDTIWLSPAIN